jgi:hypothetical protein
VSILRGIIALLIIAIAFPLFVGGGTLLDLARWVGGGRLQKWKVTRD